MFVFAITDPYLRIVTTVLAALIGLCVGSFLNVVIYRVPLHMSLASPPSHCPACGYRLRPYDNIPILSYIMLRGRCRQCGTHISFRYTAHFLPIYRRGSGEYAALDPVRAAVCRQHRLDGVERRQCFRLYLHRICGFGAH
ncbi:type 4 prepilin-like proteins leader peptide-processing enzyme [Clostridium sp. CAG:448]|nr:type 4 prepilin-like proteins leader peptide-processing enzyme [Clostridium sp. CAG:448]